MIVKSGGGYKVVSHTTGKNLGKSSTLAAAKRRLAQIQYFKSKA